LTVATGAVAQTADNFPNRPIRIIVPQAAGSGIDLQARTLAQKMGELWGQPGIVENRPGANAIIGTDAVAKASPDGYTLVYAPVSAVTTNVLIYKNLPYDPLRDFAPITQTVATLLRDRNRSRNWSSAPRPTPARSTTARSASAT
jgi:tripartite-type tricarboxylate transporter receptor subunit TctC